MRAWQQRHNDMQQVSITMIATGFGSGVVEAALRPAARRQPQQQQQQQQQTPPRQVPVERCAPHHYMKHFQNSNCFGSCRHCNGMHPDEI